MVIIIIIMIITAIAILRVQLDVFFSLRRVFARKGGGVVGTTSHQVILLVTVSEKKS